MNTAAFIHGVRDIRIGNIEPGFADNNSALVDIVSVGVCGSDLHYYKDGGIGSALIKAPFVPGHEFSARLTSDIDSSKLKRGQLVAVDPSLPCNRCEWCEKGHHNLCPDVVFLGAPPHHGALTQQLKVPIQSIIPIPDIMSADQAAMLEPLGVCIHAIDLAKPRLLESVAVLGCGPIGLGIIQLLQLSGCGDIFAIDPQRHRRTLAKKLGATHVGENIEAVLDNNGANGCHLVIEATNSPAGFQDAVNASRIGGRLVLAGIPDGNTYDSLSAADARRRGLTVKFSRRMGNVYPRAIDLVATGKVDVDELISHHFPLQGVAEAFAMQADETEGLIKSIICPGQE